MERHYSAERNLDVGAAFLWAVILNVAYVLVEALFGLWVGSLALLADAAHNLTDVFGLLIAWGAVVVGRRRPTERHPYGLGRATILAALANGIALLVAVGAIAREAVTRIAVPEPVAARTVSLGGHGRDCNKFCYRTPIFERTIARHQYKRRFSTHGGRRGGVSGCCLLCFCHHLDRLAYHGPDRGAGGERRSCMVGIWTSQIGYPFEFGRGSTRCEPRSD